MELEARERTGMEMKRLQHIAMAYFQSGSDEVQQLALDFFSEMDEDGDGKVDKKEFVAFMEQERQGHSSMRNCHFFDQVDTDGNKNLDFSEVMTIYYIIRSGRPFCELCGTFISGTFFTCVECYQTPNANDFSICPDCYGTQGFYHNIHGNNPPVFLDNFLLLKAKKNSAANEQSASVPSSPLSNATVSSNNSQNASTSELHQLLQTYSLPTSASSTVELPRSTSTPAGCPQGVTNYYFNSPVQNNYMHHPPTPAQNRRRNALDRLDTALNIIGNVVTIGGACAIM